MPSDEDIGFRRRGVGLRGLQALCLRLSWSSTRSLRCPAGLNGASQTQGRRLGAGRCFLHNPILPQTAAQVL